VTEPENADADLAAIEAAIDEWKAGDDGLPVDEAFAEIRGSERSLSQWPGQRDSDVTR